MKKIGIMSMQRINNYGSFLQAYGLKRTINNLGYDVVFVDFNIEKPVIDEIKDSLWERILRNKNILFFIRKKNYLKELNNRFINEYWPKLGVNIDRNYNPNDIDELVIGSDEVFNCLNGYPVGFSKELFGLHYEHIPVISYAACFGHTTYDGLIKYNISDSVSNLLKKFKQISVRDQNSYDTVKKLINKSPIINLDPVLIYDFDKDTIDNVKFDNYILLYAYTGRLTKDEEKYIKEFAKNNDKKIISLGFYQRVADYNLIVNPFEIFAYFKHSDYVITDTFHGSIFSIKCHKKFCSIVRYGKTGNNNKLLDLLKKLQRDDRIVKKLSDIDYFYNKDIDWGKTDNIIKKETENTIKYLKDNLM